MRRVTNILAGILGTIWLVIILAVIFSPTTPTQSATSPPVSAASFYSPAQEHRIRAAGKMAVRVHELNERLTVQCKRIGLSPSGCQNGLRIKTLQTLTASFETAVEGEVQFMKVVEAVQQYERELTPVVQALEATRLPGDR